MAALMSKYLVSRTQFGAMKRFARSLDEAEREAYVLRKGLPELSEWYDSTYRKDTAKDTTEAATKDHAQAQDPKDGLGGEGGQSLDRPRDSDKSTPSGNFSQLRDLGVSSVDTADVKDARCAALTSAGRDAAPLGENAARSENTEPDSDFKCSPSLRELGGSRGVGYPKVKAEIVADEDERILGEVREKWEKELEREKKERMDRLMENPWPEESECRVVGKLPNKWQMSIELKDGRRTSCYKGGYNLFVRERLRVRICERLGEDAIYEVVERLPDEDVVKVSPDGHTVAPNGFPDQVMPRGPVPQIVPPVPMESLVEAWRKDA